MLRTPSPSITTPRFHENDSPTFVKQQQQQQSKVSAAVESETDDIAWNDNLEEVASAMCDMAQVHLQLSMDSFRYYDSRDTWLSLPVAIIGSVIATGIAVVQQRSTENPADSQIVMYVFSALGILVTIMKIVNSIFGISEKKNKFENVKLQWERFVTYVALELYKERKHRMPARLFFERYVTDLVQLQKATPDIPRSVVKSFIRLFEGKKGSLQRMQFHQLFKPFSFPTLHPTISTRRLFLHKAASASLQTGKMEIDELARFTPTSRKMDELMDSYDLNLSSLLPKNMFTFKSKSTVADAPLKTSIPVKTKLPSIDEEGEQEEEGQHRDLESGGGGQLT